MSLIKSTATIGGFTLISRVFGYIRDMLTAHIVGANAMTDAFFVAFKLPNFFRRIFAEGAFNSAFVPIYAGTLSAEGQEKASEFAREAFSALFAILLLLTFFFILIMPIFMLVLAPGFENDPSKFALTVTLTRITFPYLLFISLVSLLGGILNSLGKYGAVAATPILMNICFIASLLLLVPYTPTPVHAMAIGVLVSGVAQYAWLHWFARKLGVMPRLRRPRMSANLKKLLILIGPAALGSSVAQVNLMVDTILASKLPNNGISYLYYADRLSELPLAVIGIAIGTALLPTLSRLWRDNKREEALASQNRALELSLLLALPAATALAIIAEPVIKVMFERGAFDAAATAATAGALQVFALGLPAFVMVKIFTPVFYAQHDTKTPFKIAGICVLINLVLNLLLMGPYLHVGMALATSIASWVNVLLLMYMLKKRGSFLADKALINRAPRMVLACALMGIALYGLNDFLAEWFAEGLVMQIIAMTILVGAGLAVYAGSCIGLRAVDNARIKTFFKK